MKLSIDDLKQYWDLLYSHLQELDVQVIELEYDYYWDVQFPSRYQIYEQPINLPLGQLTHDVEVLNQMFQGESNLVLYNFVHLSAILRMIGEMGEVELMRQQNPSDSSTSG
jgi:hypothetical protein